MNPTSGSWWIVQIQPTKEGRTKKEAAFGVSGRPDLNNPPAAAGGILLSLIFGNPVKALFVLKSPTNFGPVHLLMRTRTAIIAILVTAVLCVVGTYFAIRLLQEESAAVGPNVGALQSTILGERREYSVYLPEGYATNTNARYPVLYVLDGEWQSAHSADSASVLARIGVIPPVIVVGIASGGSRDRDLPPPASWREPHDGAEGAARFLSFLEKELIPKIDADYRTSRPRMLAGWSLGGTFVLYSQVAGPSLFDARFAHSPHLWGNDDTNTNQIEDRLMVNRPTSGFLYLSLGDQEAAETKGPFQRVVKVLETIAPVDKSQPDESGTPQKDAPSTAATNATEAKDKIAIAEGFRWRADLSVGGNHNSNPVLSTPVGLCEMFSTNRANTCRTIKR